MRRIRHWFSLTLRAKFRSRVSSTKNLSRPFGGGDARSNFSNLLFHTLSLFDRIANLPQEPILSRTGHLQVRYRTKLRWELRSLWQKRASLERSNAVTSCASWKRRAAIILTRPRSLELTAAHFIANSTNT